MLVLVAAAAFSISSPAFTDGGNIPPKFTCDAGQTAPSPALTWKEAPSVAPPSCPVGGGQST